MRFRIMGHYALSFFLACLFIVIVNVLYMRSYVYQESDLYDYDESDLLSKITREITLGSDSELMVSPALIEQLERSNIGLQIIDDTLREVYRANPPAGIAATYTPSSLVALYEQKAFTTFVESFQLEDEAMTLLLFMDPEHVKRTLYTYDVAQVGAAYNPLWLLGMNLSLLLIISYMYSYSVSQPINRMVEHISALKEGRYEDEAPGKGIYATVERTLNALGLQLKRAALESAEAEATREEWIMNLSHDIKTPLTSIMGYGEIIGDTEYPITEDERRHYRDVILDKGTYIETLLSDLNLATRLKHHQVPLKLESINLVEVLKSILIDTLNNPKVVESGHTVAYTHALEEAWCDLDHRLFKRVIQNLLQNAFEHNEVPVTVNVHVTAEAMDCVSIVIEDDGKGVDAHELTKIFTRYYRGTHTRHKSEGTGLGLAIAKDIVEAHGGTISAENSPLGGLKIELYLRRSNHEALS